jgi:hypothetical protein
MPSSWLSVVLFFLLIAPGPLFDLLADKRRALAKESAFRELGRTILASVGSASSGSLQWSPRMRSGQSPSPTRAAHRIGRRRAP